MSFSVDNTNTNMLFAHLNKQKLNSTLEHIASGVQLNKAADDASALAIANNFSAAVAQAGQSIMNANDSIGMIQIADGAMSGISENMDKVRELTLRASSATMNDANRASIQSEINTLMDSSTDMAKSASYNGLSLLDGSTTSLADTSAIVSTKVDVLWEDSLVAALKNIDTARNSIGGIRSELGSSQNQLLAQIQTTSVFQRNVASAESNLRDVDFAQESMHFNAQNVQLQVGSFVQAQSNALAQNITKLFQ